MAFVTTEVCTNTAFRDPPPEEPCYGAGADDWAVFGRDL
jgi:hypothetical protein